MADSLGCLARSEVTMLRLTSNQRALLADKLPDFGNVAVGGLVFGQALGGASVSVALAVVGVIVWISSMLLASILADGRRS